MRIAILGTGNVGRAIEDFAMIGHGDRVMVKEIGVELPPGRIMGELGFVDPNSRRTGTVECLEDGDVLTIENEQGLRKQVFSQAVRKREAQT